MRYPLDGEIIISQQWGADNAALTGGKHRGVDYACAEGTPVFAITSGRVVKTGFNKGAGNHVVIESGNLLHRYFHLSRIDVFFNDLVSLGHQIGLAGSTGLSTGPHVHLETELQGVNVDPETVINNGGTIPAPSPPLPPTSGIHVVVAGDTFWGLEEVYRLAHGTLQALNPTVDANNIQIGSTLIVAGDLPALPTFVARHYTIKEGDTFWDLHNAWQMEQGTLQALNPDVDVNNLQIGQIIRIG